MPHPVYMCVCVCVCVNVLFRCQVIDLRYMCCHQIIRVENVELYQAFEIERKSVMLKLGITDANVNVIFHGTRCDNVTGIASEGFCKTFGKNTGIYTPIFFTNQNI